MEDKTKSSFWKRLFSFSLWGLFRLVAISVAVGLLLALLNIDPSTLWSDFFGTFVHAWTKTWHAVVDSTSWAFKYCLLGAILVVPIFIVLRVLKSLRK